MTGSTAPDWPAWQESWDRQQELYLPDREERFRVMLDMVEATVGTAPRVLDLACGTGSITRRALARFPSAETTGVDLDPALLAIARGTFEGDPRTRFVQADLRDPHWTRQLPHASYDAVLTATALHWLADDDLRTLYERLGGVVRPGGVFLNADHMPEPGTPALDAAERAFRHARRRDQAAATGALEWDAWWAAVAADPVLSGPAAERAALFAASPHGDAFQPAAWHTSTLRAAGFAESRTVWASPADAMVVALR